MSRRSVLVATEEREGERREETDAHTGPWGCVDGQDKHQQEFGPTISLAEQLNHVQASRWRFLPFWWKKRGKIREGNGQGKIFISLHSRRGGWTSDHLTLAIQRQGRIRLRRAETQVAQ